MTIVNLRFVNKISVAIVTLIAVIASGLSPEKKESFFGLYLLALALVGLTYLLLCLLEPWWVRLVHSRGPASEKLPFDTLLLQYRFGMELGEILHFEKTIERPAFSSGSFSLPRRIYLQQGIASRLGSKQLQGLFAVQLANLTLERDAKLWASGGAVFMLLSFILYTISRLFPGITVSSQALLALIPLLIAFPEMLLLLLSRQLVYRADRLAARTLVYPDTLLDYLEALEGLEREEAGESYVHQEKKTDRLLRWLSGIPPYPAALERLERLGELYPRAGLLFRKIKDETVGKEAEWAVS